MVDLADARTPASVRRPSPSRLQPLRLGAIRPAGWLADRLAAQTAGMAGRLDEHWPSIRDSSWIGGTEEGWERGPYWLDGIVPLAALTDDPGLAAKVRRWVDHLLEHQEPNGWIGPEHGDRQGTADVPADLDVWPRMPLLKALLQQHSATGDPRIVPAAHRLALRIGEVLAQQPLSSWGHYRAADLIASLHELHALTGDDRVLAVAGLAAEQGYDWRRFPAEMVTEKVTLADIERWRQEDGLKLAPRTMTSHGVNIAMGLNWFAVRSRTDGDAGWRADLDRMLAALDLHHGQPTGLYSCDEHLGGRSPSQGVETCTVVEAMFSLETAIEIWGVDEALADRLERIAFNALPAAADPDDIAHQYDQQANQIHCGVFEIPIYTDNGPDSNTFGLEPHFGCCTANRHQGWPKLTARLWLRDATDGGLTAVSYAPAVVEDARDDGTLTVRVGGEYPFGDAVTISVVADRPLARPLHLRVPGWTRGATLHVAGREPEALEPGTVHTVDETWGTTAIELVLRLPAPVETHGADPVVVTSGPLLLTLPVEEEWAVLRDHGWMVDRTVSPGASWRQGLVAGSVATERATLTPGSPDPFRPEGARVGVEAVVRGVADWPLDHGAADAPPAAPAAEGPERPVVLVPYGSSRIRITVLPVVAPE